MIGIKPVVLIASAYFILFARPAFGLSLVPLTNAPVVPNGWMAVACAADGQNFAAAAYQGGLYTSTNGGATWISNAAPVKPWNSIASSADGTKLAATCQLGNGQLWTNSGTSWSATSLPTSSTTGYGSVSSSADGSRLVALRGAGGFPVYSIHASADFGATWHQTGAPNVPWSGVACSADGTKFVAIVSNTNAIFTSTDFGTNWSSHTLPFSANWIQASSSADGSKLVAVAVTGGLVTSADSGATWVSNNVPKQITWYSVTSSSDGSNIVAAGINALYTTTNFGQTWISNTPPAPLLRVIACSADGSRGIVAGATGPTSPVLYAFAPAVTTPPLLSLISSNAQFAVTWPSSVTGFQLQQNTNLTVSAWANVTNSIVVTNGMNAVFISPTNAASFYRLINQ